MLFEYHELSICAAILGVFLHWLNYSIKVLVERWPHCHVRYCFVVVVFFPLVWIIIQTTFFIFVVNVFSHQWHFVPVPTTPHHRRNIHRRLKLMDARLTGCTCRHIRLWSAVSSFISFCGLTALYTAAAFYKRWQYLSISQWQKADALCRMLAFLHDSARTMSPCRGIDELVEHLNTFNV